MSTLRLHLALTKKASFFYCVTYFCYYSAYFYYYSWVPLHFLILFMSPTVLFQLPLAISTVLSAKNFQFQQNKQILNRLWKWKLNTNLKPNKFYNGGSRWNFESSSTSGAIHYACPVCCIPTTSYLGLCTSCIG